MKRDKKGRFIKGYHYNEGTEFKKGIIPWNYRKDGKIGKQALHTWVKRRLGFPQKCGHCGTVEKRRYEWANKSREYRRDLSDWIRLCVPCHRRYDLTPEKREKAIKNLIWYRKVAVNV